MMERYINFTFAFLAVATAAHCMPMAVLDDEDSYISDTAVMWYWTVAYFITSAPPPPPPPLPFPPSSFFVIGAYLV